MPQEVHIVAVLHPKPGKLDRFNELMRGMCRDVHSKEDYTLRYLQTQQIGKEDSAEGPDIVMIETYKDKAGADKHVTESHFKELFKTFEAEGLFEKPPYLAQTVSTGGFDLDRKLV